MDFVPNNSDILKKMKKEMAINELKEKIKKAEFEGRVSDVKKLKKEFEELTNESLFDKLGKFIKDSFIKY